MDIAFAFLDNFKSLHKTVPYIATTNVLQTGF